MLPASRRHEISVTFYPTTSHDLDTCIIEGGFVSDNDDVGWAVTHPKTGMRFIYQYSAVHGPRDDGYGIKYVYAGD